MMLIVLLIMLSYEITTLLYCIPSINMYALCDYNCPLAD